MSPQLGHIDPRNPTPTRLSRTALRQVLLWLRPYRRAIVLNVCLSLVLTAAVLSVPLLLQRSIDAVGDHF